jgi:hypothetical protein
MKQFIAIFWTVVILNASALGKSHQADFDGTWNQDVSLSDAAPKIRRDDLGGPVNAIKIIISFFLSGPGVIMGESGFGGATVLSIGGYGNTSGVFMNPALQGLNGSVYNQSVSSVPFIPGGGYGNNSGMLMDSALQNLNRSVYDQNERIRAFQAKKVPGGILKPAGKKLTIQHTGNEIRITHKEAAPGQDQVEIYKLNRKNQIDMVETSIGKLKQITKVRLGKDNIEIETKTIIPGDDPIVNKTQFMLYPENGLMVMKIVAKLNKYDTQHQKFYYIPKE